MSVGVGASVAQWDIYNDKIVQIGPEWIEAMENLKFLDVHQNFLTSLPENVHKLPLKTVFAGTKSVRFEGSASDDCPGFTVVEWWVGMS